MPTVTINNDTRTRMLFSIFRKGDNGIPFKAGWVEAGQSANLETGKFDDIGIGMQIQEGGRWVGGDPANPPYYKPGSTVTASQRFAG